MKFAVLICFFSFSLGIFSQTHKLSSQTSSGGYNNSSHQNHQSDQSYRQNVQQKSNNSNSYNYRTNYNYYNTGSGLDRRKKDFRKDRIEAIKKQNYEEANRENNWKRKARRQQLIFDECIAQIYLESASKSKVDKEIVSIYLKEDEVYVVPANQTWHIWNKNLAEGENISIYSSSGKNIVMKAYPKTNNSLLLVKGENESDQKILIQEYLELEAGDIVKISDDTQAYINLK